MSSPATAWTPRLTVLLAVSLAACADPASLDRSAAFASPREIVPRLVVSDAGGARAIVTLALDVHGAVGSIGSFTARVAYDSVALRFVDEVPLNDGVMRVVHASPGLVRLAGAALQGISAARLASLRFDVRDSRALTRATFDLDELHERSRADLRALVRRAPARVVQ